MRQSIPPRTLLLARLALKNVRLNWRHSLATMLAILGGFTAVSLFDGFLLALREFNQEYYVRKGMVGHLLIEKKGAAEHLFEDLWAYSISAEEQAAVARLLEGDARVEAAMRALVVTGLLSNGRTSSLFVGSGLDEAEGVKIRGEKWAWNTIAGVPLFKAGREGIVMGSGLAEKLGCRFDPEILQKPDGSYLARERKLECPANNFQLSVTTESSQVNAIDLPPLAVTDFQLREFNEKLITLPLSAAQRLFDTDRLTRYMIFLRDPADLPAFTAELRRKAAEEKLELEIVPWMDHPIAAIAKGGQEVLRVFRGLFLSVVAVIAAMSVANSMMKSINERIREIGTLRSYGFRRRDIVLLFSFEGLGLGFFACLAGMLATTALALLLSNAGLTFKAGVLSTPMPVHFSMDFASWAITAVTLSLITFLASWLVSRRAARMVIADALRYVA